MGKELKEVSHKNSKICMEYAMNLENQECTHKNISVCFTY